MLKHISKAAMAVLVLGLSGVAGARDGGGNGGRGQGHGDRGDRDLQLWTCRADSVTHDGIFFLGMSRDRADAYTRALESCNRARMQCIIRCDLNLNF